MPVLGGGAFSYTVGDVASRIRSIVNDDSAQLWPDGNTGLLNAIKDSYTWLFGQIQRVSGTTFERVVTDITYTPTTSGEQQNLATILPIDMYLPIKLEFRLNTSEEYLEVDRVQSLPARNGQDLERLVEWVLRGQSIFVNSADQAGLIQLTYYSLVPTIAVTSDPILINNALEALAHYAAHELFRRRGQQIQSMAALGDDGIRNGNIPTGAKGFASMVLDHLVMNEQLVARRGTRFSDQRQSSDISSKG